MFFNSESSSLSSSVVNEFIKTVTVCLQFGQATGPNHLPVFQYVITQLPGKLGVEVTQADLDAR